MLEIELENDSIKINNLIIKIISRNFLIKILKNTARIENFSGLLTTRYCLPTVLLQNNEYSCYWFETNACRGIRLHGCISVRNDSKQTFRMLSETICVIFTSSFPLHYALNFIFEPSTLCFLFFFLLFWFKNVKRDKFKIDFENLKPFHIMFPWMFFCLHVFQWKWKHSERVCVFWWAGFFKKKKTKKYYLWLAYKSQFDEFDLLLALYMYMHISINTCVYAPSVLLAFFFFLLVSWPDTMS